MFAARRSGSPAFAGLPALVPHQDVHRDFKRLSRPADRPPGERLPSLPAPLAFRLRRHPACLPCLTTTKVHTWFFGMRLLSTYLLSDSRHGLPNCHALQHRRSSSGRGGPSLPGER